MPARGLIGRGLQDRRQVHDYSMPFGVASGQGRAEVTLFKKAAKRKLGDWWQRGASPLSAFRFWDTLNVVKGYFTKAVAGA